MKLSKTFLNFETAKTIKGISDSIEYIISEEDKTIIKKFNYNKQYLNRYGDGYVLIKRTEYKYDKSGILKSRKYMYTDNSYTYIEHVYNIDCNKNIIYKYNSNNELIFTDTEIVDR